MGKVKSNRTNRGKPKKNVKKSRKEIRKEQRQLKKVTRNEYYTTKKKSIGKFVKNPNLNKQVEAESNPKEKVKKTKSNDKRTELNSIEQTIQDQQKDKKKQIALEKEMFKRRKRQLEEENDKEEQGIKKLEKQLKINRKNKSKSVPKSFASDGLDYLLELCQSDTLAQAAKTEQQLADTEMDDYFDDDFNMVLGKNTNKTTKKSKKTSSDRSENKSEEFEDLSDEDSELGDSINKTNSTKHARDSDLEFDDSLEMSNDDIDSEEYDSDVGDSEEEGEFTDEDSEMEHSLNKTNSTQLSSDMSGLEFDDTIGEDSLEMSEGEIHSEEYDSEAYEAEVAEAYLGLGEFPDGIFRPDNLSPVVEETNSDIETYTKGGKLIIKKMKIRSPPKRTLISDDAMYNFEDDTEEEEIKQKKMEILKMKNAELYNGKLGNNTKIKTRTEMKDDLSEDSELEMVDSDDIDSECFDQTDSEDDVEVPSKITNKNGVWEDIYGRTRDKEGNVVKETGEKYIPPQARAKQSGTDMSDKLLRLRRQLKGLLNRLAENNMLSIATEIDGIYMSNSRHDTNDSLSTLSLEALIGRSTMPDLMIAHHAMLVAILHANVGSEVGAHYLQSVIKHFDDLLKEDMLVENKKLDNTVCVLAHLYNFKIFSSQLIIEILTKLSTTLTEKTLDCVLVILRCAGFCLRKEDPAALKDAILALQGKANNAPATLKDNSRLKFMLDVLLAIKNNNVTKIPSYDPSHTEHLKKTLRGYLRKGNYVTPINVSLDDLLKADERGKWWVVGSAWSGEDSRAIKTDPADKSKSAYSQRLLELAKAQRMNTDIRRNIFCAIVSADDYLDAFEQVMHLGLKGSQEREVAHVLLSCALQEKTYNPFYSILSQKFCDFNRKYQMSLQYGIWDKLRDVDSLSPLQLGHLAKYLTHLFIEKGLPLSVLKIIEFSELQKASLRLVRQILLGILLHSSQATIEEVFDRISVGPKLRVFRQGLRLFLHHFILGSKNKVPAEQKELLEQRVKMADQTLSAGDSKIEF